MTTDERLHYIGGYLKALPWRFVRGVPRQIDRIREIDQWAFDREWQQNLAGEDVNETLSEHQLREAMAWGHGARAALCVFPYWPSCYYTGRPDSRG